MLIRRMAVALLLVSCVCAGIAQPAPEGQTVPAPADTVEKPTSAPGVTPPALLKTYDAENRLIETAPNPEASRVWNAKPKVKAAKTAPKTNLLWETVNTIFKLVLVLTISYFLALVFKKFFYNPTSPMKGLMLGDRSSAHIRVEESVSLGQGRQVHLLTVGSRRFLIGVTPQQVSMLEEIAAEDLSSDGEEPTQPPAYPTSDPFRSTLARVVSSFGGATNKRTSPNKEDEL